MDNQQQEPRRRRRTQIRNYEGAGFGNPSEEKRIRWDADAPGGSNPTVLNPNAPGGSNPTVLNPNAPGRSNPTVLNPNAPGGSSPTVLNPNAPGGNNATVLNPNAPGGSNATVLNPNVPGGSNATMLNPNAPGGSNATALNPQAAGGERTAPAPDTYESVPEGSLIPEGTELFGKYMIQERLHVQSGEADLYVASYNGRSFVAKVYRRKSAIKPGVVRKLLAIQSPYVAQIYDMGDFQGHTVEVTPYYQHGTLQGQRFGFQDLKEWIIPSLNEGLKAIHQQGIIHKDLKPSNIMLNDDGKSVSIIDFGISSVKEDGETLVITQTGRTPVYSAPETISNLFLAESDYYSLGVSIFELFTGTLPYEGFSDEQRMRMFALQRIPCPANMPEELKQLIWGLTYADLSNRENKKNPNRRWTYEEVCRWCKGEKQITPGDTASAALRDRPYSFKEQSYTDYLNLVLAFNQNWEDGKKQLFRGMLRGYFESIDQTKATCCAEAEDEVSRVSGREDYIFFRTMYQICPEMKQLIWKGYVFSDLADFGKELLNGLRRRDAALEKTAQELMEQGILSEYCRITLPHAKAQQDSLKRIEDGISAVQNHQHEKLVTLYQIGYLLSHERTLVVNGFSFDSIDSLTAYLLSVVNKQDEFDFLYQSLIDDRDNLDPQFESWMIVQGKQNELAAWKKNL